MYYSKLVEQTYKEAIALMKDMPSGLRSSLKSHERIPLFLKNMAIELDKLQKHRISKGANALTDVQVKKIVYDFTDVFIQGVKAKAEADYQSHIQKQLLEAEAQKAKDLDATASGKVSGDYADIFKEGGVTTTDERSV